MRVKIGSSPGWHLSHAGGSVYLTPFEGQAILALMCHSRVPRELAAEILWPNPDTMPEEWHNQIRCVMSRIRTKLRPFGWNVESRYGFGWKLERHDAGTAQETQRKAA